MADLSIRPLFDPKYTLADRISYLQQIFDTETPAVIREEFIYLSDLIHNAELEDEAGLFDYTQIILIHDDMFGARIVGFEQGLNVRELWVRIPCNFDGDGWHGGVNCRLIDHLNGHGCDDCAKQYGFGGMYPYESYPMD